MSENVQRVMSPVDYDAWSRGYMPPSEHVLIDQLQFRGARVISASDYGERGAWWLVARGDILNNPKARLLIYQTISDAEVWVPADVRSEATITNGDDAAQSDGEAESNLS